MGAHEGGAQEGEGEGAREGEGERTREGEGERAGEGQECPQVTLEVEVTQEDQVAQEVTEEVAATVT